MLPVPQVMRAPIHCRPSLERLDDRMHKVQTAAILQSGLLSKGRTLPYYSMRKRITQAKERGREKAPRRLIESALEYEKRADIGQEKDGKARIACENGD